MHFAFEFAAVSKIDEWKKQKKAIVQVESIPERDEKKNQEPFLLSEKSQRKNNSKFNQELGIKSEEKYQSIRWKSGTYCANASNNTIYPLHGRGLPEGRYFITARLKQGTKINPETIDKMLKVIERGKIAPKRGDQGVQLIRKEKGASRYFGKFSYFAKVKIFAVGGVGEPRGYCTQLEISEDQNHVLLLLTDICQKVH
ncbi:MAG: hypothetical protein HKM04_00660 [Legionellales bacterium]|nr:hypothetical protein [Legionellales bacterium]